MFTYEIDTEKGIVRSNFTGRFSNAILMMHMQLLFSDGDFSPEFHSIIELDESTMIHAMTDDELSDFRNLIWQAAQMRKGTRWALVAANGSVKAFAEVILKDVAADPATLRIFSSAREAETWVLSPAG